MEYSDNLKNIMEISQQTDYFMIIISLFFCIFSSFILMHVYKKIIIIEEHSSIGGLTSLVKNISSDQKSKSTIIPFTLKDNFIHCYGSNEDLLDAHNLSSKYILRKISSILS